jgi:crossover junction endodeoxyribonuclease RuvC
MTIVFGVDPGSVYTGFGVVCLQGRAVKHVDSGRICAGRSGVDFPARLVKIYQDLTGLLVQHQPDCIAIESVFSQVNVASAIKLGQARGVALLACAQHCRGSISEYSPRAVKKSVTGYGGSEKAQVAFMVKQLLGLQCSLSEDAADALALAIFCASTLKIEREKIG